MIYYVVSLIFAVFVMYYKKINIFNIYGFFILFSTLYASSTYIVSNVFNSIPLPNVSLIMNKEVVNIHLIISAITIFFYSLVYFLFYKNVDININDSIKVPNFIFKLMYLIVFIFLLMTSYSYGWHAYTHNPELNTPLTSIQFYMKLFFLSLAIYYLVHYGLKNFYLILITQLIIMFLDGGRTTFFPLFILFISMILMQYKLNLTPLQYRNRVIKYVFIGVILFFLLILSRALVMENFNNIYLAMLSSFFIEGVMGSYSSLQSIDVLFFNDFDSYSYGMSYIFDPMLWIFPSSSLRENFTFLNQFIIGIQPLLAEKFSPMGGFYFLAEANANFPIIGPIIVTVLFAFITIIIERKKRNNKSLYMIYYSTMGVLFTKMIFGNLVKLFVIVFVFYFFINIILRIRIKK